MRTALLLVVATFVAGCVGKPTMVGPEPPKGFVLGAPAKGGACGTLLFGVIPIGVNDRAERAYRQAVQKSGGHGLVDTTVRDRWYWIYIGELVCTDIEGTAYTVSGAASG